MGTNKKNQVLCTSWRFLLAFVLVILDANKKHTLYYKSVFFIVIIFFSYGPLCNFRLILIAITTIANPASNPISILHGVTDDYTSLQVLELLTSDSLLHHR